MHNDEVVGGITVNPCLIAGKKKQQCPPDWDAVIKTVGNHEDLLRHWSIGQMQVMGFADPVSTARSRVGFIARTAAV